MSPKRLFPKFSTEELLNEFKVSSLFTEELFVEPVTVTWSM